MEMEFPRPASGRSFEFLLADHNNINVVPNCITENVEREYPTLINLRGVNLNFSLANFSRFFFSISLCVFFSSKLFCKVTTLTLTQKCE